MLRRLLRLRGLIPEPLMSRPGCTPVRARGYGNGQAVHLESDDVSTGQLGPPTRGIGLLGNTQQPLTHGVETAPSNLDQRFHSGPRSRERLSALRRIVRQVSNLGEGAHRGYETLARSSERSYQFDVDSDREFMDRDTDSERGVRHTNSPTGRGSP